MGMFRRFTSGERARSIGGKGRKVFRGVLVELGDVGKLDTEELNLHDRAPGCCHHVLGPEFVDSGSRAFQLILIAREDKAFSEGAAHGQRLRGRRRTAIGLYRLGCD